MPKRRRKSKCRTISTHKKKRAAKRAAQARSGARVVGRRGKYRVVKCN